MPVSCHFRDCKALLSMCSTCSSALSSTGPLPLPLITEHLTYLATMYLCRSSLVFDYLTAGVSSDSEHTLSAPSLSSKLKPRIIERVINCVCEQNVDVPPLVQVCHTVTGVS